MNAFHNRLGNPQSQVAAFASRSTLANDQDTRLALEEFPHNIGAEFPNLRNLRHREVEFTEAFAGLW